MSALQQLCARSVTHQRRNGSTEDYPVCAATKDDRRLELVKSLPEADQALYLEQEIERFAALPDQPKRGELERA